MAWNKLKIDIQEVLGGSDLETVAYYARGRFTPREFLKAAQKHHSLRLAFNPNLTDANGEPMPRKLEGKVVNEFWRNEEGHGDLDHTFKSCAVRDPGAYAVTVYNLEDWER